LRRIKTLARLAARARKLGERVTEEIQRIRLEGL
jgi:hypothetical protein